MKRFETQIDIAAPPSAIWSLLTDVARYPEWNPTVTRVEGTVSPGAKITVHARVSPGKAFPVRVSELGEPTRMVWRGGMPLGLFQGVRTFTLTPTGSGITRFTMVEEYRGLMAGLIVKSIPDLGPEFNAFAAALKATSEGS